MNPEHTRSQTAREPTNGLGQTEVTALLLDGQRCRNPRCAALLPSDAEICDECGGADLESLRACAGLLLGQARERPVAFSVRVDGPTTLGRAAPGTVPDVDLSSFPGAESVHRRHAVLELDETGWHLTHEGRNPLVIQRQRITLVIPPDGSELLQPDDRIIVGTIELRFLVPALGITAR